jgi:hypothetical protein
VQRNSIPPSYLACVPKKIPLIPKNSFWAWKLACNARKQLLLNWKLACKSTRGSSCFWITTSTRVRDRSFPIVHSLSPLISQLRLILGKVGIDGSTFVDEDVVQILEKVIRRSWKEAGVPNLAVAKNVKNLNQKSHLLPVPFSENLSQYHAHKWLDSDDFSIASSTRL